jgi:hypothetical protein
VPPNAPEFQPKISDAEKARKTRVVDVARPPKKLSKR